MKMICKQCGAQFEEGKYCPNCGSYVEEETVLSLEGGGQSEVIENEELSKDEQRVKNNAIRRAAITEKKANNRFPFVLGAVVAIIIVIIFALGLSSDDDSSSIELYSYRNVPEDTLISELGFSQNPSGNYPSDENSVFFCSNGQVNKVCITQDNADDYTFMGVKISDNAEDAKSRLNKGFTYQDTKTDDSGDIVDYYSDEDGQVTVTYDMQDYDIISICYTTNENTAAQTAETEAKTDDTKAESKETNDETKIIVEGDSYQTVVTAKSNNMNNIQLFTSAGGKDKAGKIPEGVPCALLKQQDVDGEKWAQIDYCNRQGWCKMEMLRTVSGDTKYFYVRADDTNTIFVNEDSIKLHLGAGNKTETIFTDVPYGTELSIYELNNGWGRTMYDNTECWIDMNVAGFYASEYWQVERCDGSTTGIKLRESASENSDTLTTVPLRTVLDTKDFKNGWAKFSYDNKTGWMKLHYATPCGSTSGLSFSEDKTETTTETQPTTEAVAPKEPEVRFSEYYYPYSGYYYSYARGYYEGVYMVLEDVSDTQFTFTIYNEDGVLFQTHTAVATSENTAYYDGVDYDLTFKMDGEGGINVFGLEEFLGKYNYFEYES